MALARWKNWMGLAGVNAIIDYINQLSIGRVGGLLAAPVTNSSLQDMAQATIKGRAAAAGTGSPTDLTANQVSTVLDSATDPFLRTSASGGGFDLDDLGDVVVPTPSDGDVLTFDSGSGDWIAAAAGTGGASITYKSAFASPPGSPNSGDLWFITDSFYIGRYNGASWDYFHRGMQVYPPTTSGWSWDNQGTSTVTQTGGALYFVGQTAASDNYRIYYRTAPATPYTVTAIILPHLGLTGTGNFPTVGICFRENSSGKFITLGQQLDDFFVQKWNGPTSFNSTTYSRNYGLMLRSSAPIYLRINDDGATNLTFSYSIDGINYNSLGTIGRTAFGTPDQYGLFVQAGAGGSEMTVISLKET